MCAYPTLLSEFSMTTDTSRKDGGAVGDGDSPADSPSADTAAEAAAPAADEEKKPVDLVAASGKLRMLQQLLPALQAGGHRVLLLSQSRKVTSLSPLRIGYRQGLILYALPDGALSICVKASNVRQSCSSGSSTHPLEGNTCRQESEHPVSQALDTIEDFVRGAYGATAYERIDGGTHAAHRHAAVQRFNQADSPAWCAFMRSCFDAMRSIQHSIACTQ